MQTSDTISLVCSFFDEVETLLNFKLISKDFHKSSEENELYWSSACIQENPKNRNLFRNVLNDFFKFWDQKIFHLKIILKNSIPNWKMIHLFGYNLFSHPTVLELISDEKFQENLKILREIDYPLTELRFVSKDLRFQKYLGEENYFTILHFAVWTNNLKLCQYLTTHKIGNEPDLLYLHPFTYSILIGDNEISKILQSDFQGKKRHKYEILVLQKHHIDLETLNKTPNIGEISQMDESEDLEETLKEDEVYFKSYKPDCNRIIPFYNNKPNWVDNYILSEDDSDEEGIRLEDVLEEDLTERVKEFETEERFYHQGMLESYVRTINRKPSLKRDWESDSEEPKAKIQKLDAYTRKNFVFPKDAFNSLAMESLQDYSIDKNFTPLSLFILQDFCEAMIEKYLQNIQILTELGFGNFSRNVLKILQQKSKTFNYGDRNDGVRFPPLSEVDIDFGENDEEYKEEKINESETSDYESDESELEPEDDPQSNERILHFEMIEEEFENLISEETKHVYHSGSESE
jgi:hypothetical protein